MVLTQVDILHVLTMAIVATILLIGIQLLHLSKKIMASLLTDLTDLGLLINKLPL